MNKISAILLCIAICAINYKLTLILNITTPVEIFLCCVWCAGSGYNVGKIAVKLWEK